MPMILTQPVTQFYLTFNPNYTKTCFIIDNEATDQKYTFVNENAGHCLFGSDVEFFMRLRDSDHNTRMDVSSAFMRFVMLKEDMTEEDFLYSSNLVETFEPALKIQENLWEDWKRDENVETSENWNCFILKIIGFK